MKILGPYKQENAGEINYGVSKSSLPFKLISSALFLHLALYVHVFQILWSSVIARASLRRETAFLTNALPSSPGFSSKLQVLADMHGK